MKQAAFLVAAGFLVRVIGFLYRLPMTALIGDEGNGIYGSGYTIYNFFLILSSAGLPAAISKMVSERRALGHFKDAHRVFQVSLLTAGITGFFAAILLAVFARPLAEFVNNPLSVYSIWTLSPTVFIVALLSVYRGYFQGCQNTMPTAISQIFEQIFNGIFSVYLAYMFLKDEGRVEMGAAGGTAGTGIGAFVGLLFIIGIYYLIMPVMRKRIKRDNNGITETDGSIVKELFSTAIPIITGTAVFSLTGIIDLKMVMERLLAAQFSESEALSLFGMLTGKYVTLTTLPVAVTTALATAALPNVAASFVKKEYALVEEKVNLAIRLAMFVSIPATVGMSILARQILYFLFRSYPKGHLLITVGAISVVFLAITQIATGLLQGIGKVKIPVIAAICGGLVKIPLNYVLVSIPEINVVGAVISTIACYMVAAAIDFTVLVKTLKIRIDYTSAFIKPLISSAIMGLVCFVVYYMINLLFPEEVVASSPWLINAIGLFLSVAAGILSYAVSMLALKGFTDQELRYIPGAKKLLKLLKK